MNGIILKHLNPKAHNNPIINAIKIQYSIIKILLLIVFQRDPAKEQVKILAARRHIINTDHENVLAEGITQMT